MTAFILGAIDYSFDWRMTEQEGKGFEGMGMLRCYTFANFHPR